MPRFFDDYSNTYLTHDSSAGRKQQRRGWKFRENFRLHYEKFVPEWRRGHMGLASAQQAFVRARGADNPAVPPLPDGWKEATDDVTGISYFVDPEGKRTWVRPGFIPPPPGAMPPPNAQQRPPPAGGAYRAPPPPPRPQYGAGAAPPATYVAAPNTTSGGPPPPPPPPNLQQPPPGAGGY